MRRLPGLDLLRAAAILSVICTHSWIAGGMGYGFGWIEEYGWMGVDLFFVLSGYLIGRQVLGEFKREGRLDLKAFYRRRAYRILPAYVVVIAFYFCFPALRETPAIQPLWQFLTFTMNLLVNQNMAHAFSSAWSLCVEEHFYLVFPLAVIALAPRSSKWRLIALLLGIVAFGIAWRGYAWWQSAALTSAGDAWDMDGSRYMELVYYPTYARLDGLLAGVAIAVLSVYRPMLWERAQKYANAIGLAGAVAVWLSAWIFQDILTLSACAVGFPLLSLGLALVVTSATSPSSLLSRVRVPGAAWIATASYSIYLTHKAMLSLVYRHLPAPLAHQKLLTFGICLIVAIAAAAALHYLVERPFLLLRDRTANKRVVTAAA